MACTQTSTACKDAQETRPLIFDYTSALGGATIASATIEVITIIGDDLTPLNLLDGAAIVASPRVTQWLKDGIVGDTYSVRCVAVTSDGRTLVGAKNIAVVRR
jgi:hypothetical protein